MKHITILIATIAGLAFQACDVTQVPEEHRPAADSIIRADSARRAVDTVHSYAWSICAGGRDGEVRYEGHDASFWGILKVRVGRDTMETPRFRADSACTLLGTFPDTTHLRILSTSTATGFDSIWVQVDTIPTKFWAGWRQVLLRPDSVQVLSDSVYLDGSRGMNKARRGSR